MDKKMVQFEVSSPTQLQEALSAHGSTDGAQFAVVRVFGSNILTWPFSFPKSSAKELIAGLKLEASGILSVDVKAINVAYHIIDQQEGRVSGICSAMRQDDLQAYVDCFKSSPMIPVSLTASAISVPLDFIKNHPASCFDFCVINFIRPQMISIAVFADNKPVLFRELDNMVDADLGYKIHDTIRYACSHSTSKKIDHVFFTGDLRGKEALITQIKALEVPNSSKRNANHESRQLKAPNLLESYALDTDEHTTLARWLTMIVVGVAVAAIVLTWQYVRTHAFLHAPSAIVNADDYQKALRLKDQLRRISHE